jgi:glycosyltransferase involved in cell wall biosynthesis
MLVAELMRRKSALAKRIWLAIFDRRNVEGAAAIHVTSEIEATELRTMGLKLPRIEIVPNGIDITTAAAGDPTRGAIPDRRPYVLFLGRISWKKGLDRLIAAMPLVEDVDLVIAGYDENGYQALAERLAFQAHIIDRTHFIGPVEGEAKWSLIRNALCLALPSYNENFGMVVMEAMAAGCPVVVTEEVGLADVVRASGSGLVASGQPSELAKAITAVAGSPERRCHMGAAGKRTASEHFGWPAIAKKMQAIYHSLGNKTK